VPASDDGKELTFTFVNNVKCAVVCSILRRIFVRSALACPYIYESSFIFRVKTFIVFLLFSTKEYATLEEIHGAWVSKEKLQNKTIMSSKNLRRK
jgi:hypothetical protein